MSIATEIVALEAVGHLTRYMPRGPRQPDRRLFLTTQAAKDLYDPKSATNSLVGRGYIEAALARWCLKGRIVGTARRGTFLDRLCSPPSEVWEVRVTEPIVQARLFGRFAEPDTLILTRFHTRGNLGNNKGAAGWISAMNNCVADWNAIFPTTAPFSAKMIQEYVTENCDAFPLCP